MAQFDIYGSPRGSGYLLNVQADFLGRLNTCVVVTMMPMDAAPTPEKCLNRVFDIQSERYVMVTQFLSALPTLILKTPVASLAQHDMDFTGALDLFTTGV